MALVAGRRIGPYEVTDQIGIGGMGEVWRATDTVLGRQVAIKILPDAFARDPERLARFEREARILASLNHANIATIHGLEKSSDHCALVMELVEGPTLADRITDGPIPVAEALAIATEIAEALEAAHEQGIIHRDLKPANVKVREDGTVKVLDFGLAKLIEPGSGSRDSGSAGGRPPKGGHYLPDDRSVRLQPDFTQSPTITTPAMTQMGMILGTAAYMSPEQAKGRPADKRSDIWALGCVLYEMLTGARAFDGEDVSDTLAAVLRGEPDWKALPRVLPASIHRLLRGSLRKDRRARLSDVAVVRFLLDEHAEPRATAGQSGTRSWLVVATTVAVIAAASAGAMWLWMRPGAQHPRPPMRVAVVPPSDQTFTLNGNDRVLALSPDGSRLVYAVGQGQLMVRSMDRLEAEPLRGVTDARAPFISSDGKWIGFFGSGEVRKVSFSGGPPISLCPYTGTPRGASWGPDGQIVFATNNTTTGLLSVAQNGGEPVVLTKPDIASGEVDHPFPAVLPNGRAIRYTVSREGWEMQVAALDLSTRQPKVLIRGASHAEYVETGHLIYAAGGRLQAIRFDPVRLEVQGDPIPLSEPVTVLPVGTAEYSISRTGTLVYVPTANFASDAVSRTLVWVDRQGREEALGAPARAYSVPRLSPDDSQVAVIVAEQELDLWMWDIARRTLRRLTFDPRQDAMPNWTRDGRRLIFSSAQSAVPNIFSLPVSGGQPERLSTSAVPQYPMTISADGRFVVLLQLSPNTSNDLMLLRLAESPASRDPAASKAEPLLATMFIETNASISPDGRWLAYQSNEGGQVQVYVRPFPDVNDGISQISSAGGIQPTWSRTGTELFYAEEDGSIMAVPVRRHAPSLRALQSSRSNGRRSGCLHRLAPTTCLATVRGS